MNIRAKFKVDSVTLHQSGETIKMSAVCYDGTAENASFCNYTPTGSFEMSVTNEAIFGAFKPGEEHYLDFTPAE